MRPIATQAEAPGPTQPGFTPPPRRRAFRRIFGVVVSAALILYLAPLAWLVVEQRHLVFPLSTKRVSPADAGLEWADAGCSMCVGMNGDEVPPGERCASTTNRNFKGRQGKGSRTHLMSPAMAAAAAVTGHLADARPLLAGRRP